MLKRWLQRWLGIVPHRVPKPPSDDELRQLVAKVFVEVLEGKELTYPTMFTHILGPYKPFEQALQRAIYSLTDDELRRRAEKACAWIQGEDFLDRTVERLRRKQLPCSPAAASGGGPCSE